VLDFTRVVAGPYATRVLADFGAEVIKIQTAKTARGAEDNATAYFAAWNRNKKSITLNMNHCSARELFCRLVAQSDVVAENFTPRVMANWGLTYDRLREYKPDLIMLSISGLGQSGPWKDYAAYGPTLQSLGGLTHLTSFPDEAPLGIGYTYADPIIGLYGAIAVLAALEHREKTGSGQYIDLSGFEAVCTLIGPALLDYSANHREAVPGGNDPAYEEAAPYGPYRCRGTDQWCVIAVTSEGQWQALCRAVGHREWSAEARFAGPAGRREHRDALDALLAAWTGERSADEAVRILQEAGVPAGVVQTAEDLARDPHLKARDFFVTLAHPQLGDSVSDTYPFRFPEGGPASWQAAPLLGQDNAYVFGELLGLAPEEIARLVEEGIIS